MERNFTYIDDVVEGIDKLIRLAPKANKEWDERKDDLAVMKEEDAGYALEKVKKRQQQIRENIKDHMGAWNKCKQMLTFARDLEEFARDVADEEAPTKLHRGCPPGSTKMGSDFRYN